MEKESSVKGKKGIVLPTLAEWEEMDVKELTNLKKKLENMLDIVGRLLRNKIQR